MSDTASASLDLAAVMALRDAGRPAEAEARLHAAGEPEAQALLAHVQLLQGKLAPAQATYEALAAQAPGSAAAQRTAARLLQRSGRIEPALAAARAAHALAPQDDETTFVLANALLAAGDADAAHPLIADLAARRPGNGPAQFILAQVAGRLGRKAEALAACGAALAARPDLPLWAFQGALQLELGDPRAAAESFTRALAASPEDVTAMLGLADARRKLGDADGARAMFEAVLTRQPSLGVVLQTRPLPAIPASNAEIAEARTRFARTIAEAAAAPGQLVDFAQALSSTWFYLAFHGQDDRPIVEALDRLFAAKAPSLRTRAPHLADWRPPQETGRRIKLAFVSQFLTAHTIGRLNKGLIAKLDRSVFEVVVAHLQPSEDPLAQAIDRVADVAIDLPPGPQQQRERLEAERLDIVVYPDIGMGMGSYLLAQARLAPVQVVGCGHPVTTGLSTLDYFLSSDLMERPGAEDDYTERLIRLNRLPWYYDDTFSVSRVGRAALGLPPAGTLYGCTQSLFKIHPDFDAVLADILARDPEGWLVFLAGTDPSWEDALRRRWAERFPQINGRAIFPPRAPLDGYLRLGAEMDVQLDPPHFGAGNTFYECAWLGVPMVTWPGRYARGRIVVGAYRQMDIDDAPVAERLEDYAALAVGLARDPGRRAALSAQLRARVAPAMLHDAQTLREHEAFFQAAVAAAGRGEALPRGWTPAA